MCECALMEKKLFYLETMQKYLGGLYLSRSERKLI